MTHRHVDYMLEVVICAYGQAGLDRIARHAHPEVEGVRYLACVQGSGIVVPEMLCDRRDFTVLVHDTRGLSKNRNFGMRHATGDIVLISDDDIDYTPAGLEAVAAAFKRHRDRDFLTFRFSSVKGGKRYPVGEFDLRRPAKGYYPTSFEIAYRREAVAATGVSFDEDFEIGGRLFDSGGEDIFIHELLQSGLRGWHVAEVVCHHEGETTADRMRHTPGFVMTKGAVLSVLKPLTWRLRLAMAARHRGSDSPFSFFKYMELGIKGARMLRNSRKG